MTFYLNVQLDRQFDGSNYNLIVLFKLKNASQDPFLSVEFLIQVQHFIFFH